LFNQKSDIAAINFGSNSKKSDLSDGIIVAQSQLSTAEKLPKKSARTFEQHLGGTSTISYNEKYKNLVPKLVDVIHRAKEEYGCPAISFAINHNGTLVLKGGMGLADVENYTPCNNRTIMRIASISKSLTTLLVGELTSPCFNKVNVTMMTHTYHHGHI
jgi:CubicO group peptidase (beta-lactamase class C family)